MGAAAEAGDLMAIAISPHFTDEDFQNQMFLENKVAVFADRVRGWQLDIAEQLSRNVQHSGFGVLSIVFSYFEMIGKYIDGSPNSSEPSRPMFKKGLFAVFPELGPRADVENIVSILWKNGRNGLYHSGLTQGPILITDNLVQPLDFDPEGKWLMIGPHLLVQAVQRHFSSYVANLLDPANTDQRVRFERCFDGVPQKAPLP